MQKYQGIHSRALGPRLRGMAKRNGSGTQGRMNSLEIKSRDPNFSRRRISKLAEERQV
jgi:hypothetical protein